MLTVVTLKALVIWASILVIAVANGILRESLLIPGIGTPAALVLSGLLLSTLIIGVAYLSLPWLQISRTLHLWVVGLGWLALTLVFEFSFGIWQGKLWPELLEAYTFKSGNIWPVVLAATALAPRIAAKLRGNSRLKGQ
ncbi:hypothetical protein [Lacimicrobium alkaliphilum]|uniref:Uncharacterized protein n=1 Tax=Lacimicrobium alkaliphilum TaxID=1526571 RepID=A0ABQ1R5A6_9ALTE|nr:hypothetical protein [Lacimicrobium alkaliphilum]GGD55150.1 hypothetical protein GCM10011357_08560 [Lacimicrobium alkaliphilum]